MQGAYVCYNIGMKNEISMVALFGLLAVLVVAAALLLGLSNTMKQQRSLSINSFDECALAGYPIMESYPEQCATPDGRTFVNPNPVTPSEPIVSNGCVVAGCSGQLCISQEDSDKGFGVSTCEYRAEYGCYQEASCEPQADGKCGWTQTNELKACLKNPPALE